ncbi:MAG: type II/IV secretion system protein, partial [Epsilonproteobacteria bacterium]|nr:type II/IV secretion system protein [Campylobacterota bacterium]NPA64960.1 type II/IV secretion system protein [Campylobacterota bacterium]
MRRSFTVLEFIIVIIVIGILAATIVPRLQTDKIYEAANQILSHIRYTQHLAIVDEKIDPSDQNWYKRRWQIYFFQSQKASSDGNTKWAYAIFSDSDEGVDNYDGQPNPSFHEIAIDPLTKKYISGGYTLEYSNPKTYKEAA